MVNNRSGLIVNVCPNRRLTSILNNVQYGIEKLGYDQLTCDYANDLQKHNVTIISLSVGPINWCGNVQNTVSVEGK